MSEMIVYGEEPPYLSVGTEVSAKYKGAFCEAKVRKVEHLVKCKVAFKLGYGSHTVLDSQIKGILRVNSNIEARHPEKKEFVEGTITKIQDCSQYTVVFDDGDITTLRRSALCLKSGRHFAESETLDQLPLTHPEHFGNPVVGGRRGGRRRLGSDESSGEEEIPRKGKPPEELETEIGKVICVELGDKKKVKDNWFPGLVVSPSAQDTVRIRVKEEFLVRSFKDARYYTVPKKEASEFTREIGLKVDNNTLKAAVDKALTFLDKDELPPHWDREQLFRHNQSEDSDSDGGLDSDSSDDEPREEKDHFVAQLYKFMDDRGTPINGCPSVCSRDLDLYKLFKIVHKMNGYNRVSNHNQWKIVSTKLAFGNSPGVVTQVYTRVYTGKSKVSDEEVIEILVSVISRMFRSYMKIGKVAVIILLFKDLEKNYNKINRLKHWEAKKVKRVRQNEKDIGSEVFGKGLRDKAVKVKHAYKKYLHSFEDFYRKLGCTMVNHPRTGRVKNRSGRSLIRDKDRSTPVNMKTDIKDDSNTEASTSVVEAKKLIKEEEVKPKSKIDEVKIRDKDESKDTEKCEIDSKRPPSSLRKKFPTLKASPRTKDDPPVLKRRGDKLEEQTPSRQLSTRPKRTIRENSMDDGRTSEEESTKNSVEEQRSTTRAKSKEDLMKQMIKKETSDPRRGKSSSKSSDSDGSKKSKNVNVEDAKKSTEPLKSKRVATDDISVKKNRKRRNTDTGGDESSRPCLPRNKSVFVGDVLKVYYGTSNDPNGIYEAKVVDIEEDSGEQMFLVHYSGWNSRYDEWVKRNKIAENLTWTARRAKATPVKLSRLGVTKKKVGTSKTEPARSTTPSSITSSSSRTKSPATPIGTRRRTQRREEPRPLAQRRTRRMSGHTEASIGSQSDSESESVDSETDSENKLEAVAPLDTLKTDEPGAALRKTARHRAVKKPSADPPSCNVDKKKPRIMRRNSKLEKDSDDSINKSIEAVNCLTKASGSDVENLEALVPGTSNAHSSPKGRDFDLNEIRSELKGIDKAVKLSADTLLSTANEADIHEPEPVEKEEAISIDDLYVSKTELEEAVKEERDEGDDKPPIVEVNAVNCKVEVQENAPVLIPEVSIVSNDEQKEDVYEFKEPEPFDFQEVRRPIRIFDDVIEKSPEKVSAPKVSATTSPVRTVIEKLEANAQDELKSRFRKTINKKLRESCEEKTITDSKKAEENSPLKIDAEEDEVAPPQLIAAELIEAEEVKEEPEVSPTTAQKLSPEPPCLVPVTEALPCHPPEHSPMLTREDLPRLRSESSSSDSESEERLVIANDDESISNDLKPDTIPLSPPALSLEERPESPLSESKLKRIEDSSQAAAENFSTEVFDTTKPSTSAPNDKDGRDFESSDSENCLAAGSSRGSIRSLVCDEVIPGSPAPKDPNDEVGFQAPPASVIENTPPTTPPTTPDSNASSPRQDMAGGLYQSMEFSSVDNESSKSQRDSSELDMDQEGQRSRSWKYDTRSEKDCSESPSKRKRNRKRSNSGSEVSKRIAIRNSRFDSMNSDSDDSDNSLGMRNSDPLLLNRSPRPFKYNFCKEPAQDMDSTQKINYITCQIQELRKTYLSLKNQVASIDRRKKKLRKKDRESKVASAVSTPSAAPPAKSQEIPSVITG